MEIKVLNHGHVGLVSSMGDDSFILNNARVSHDACEKTGMDPEADAKLVGYLMKNRHTSPFEGVKFMFDVKAPIFVLRQWHRHRTWSYNEVSARYTELPEEYYLPEAHLIGKQSTKNKQMRDLIQNIPDEELRWREEEIQWVQSHCYDAFTLYRKLIARGWPRELARTVLPLATYSHMRASVDLHNLFHFLRLRLHEHAQHEIQVYAEAMLQLIEGVAPAATAAFKASLEQ